MTDSMDREKLKSFLFFELNDDERQALEERFFEDETLFYELMELENELVDRYVGEDLTDADRTRFERSLESSPERREKVANATALHAFIAEETSAAAAVRTETAEPGESLWAKIAAFFTFKMPVMQYATAALLLLLTGGMAFLIYERVNLGNRLADLENERRQQLEELQRRENELDERLKRIEQREKDLQNQLRNDNGQTNDVDRKLEELQEEKQKTESEQNRIRDESEKLKRNRDAPSGANKRAPGPPKPTITTILLTPYVGSRGGPNDKIPEIDPEVTSVSANLQIPKEAADVTYTVTFNGAAVKQNVKPEGGTLNVTVSTAGLTPGVDNLIRAVGSNGRRITYVFRVKKN
jgi:TolA-binding protein